MKFSGVLNWRDSEGHCGTIGDFHDIEANSKEEAEKIVLDEHWDSRLDSAGCGAEIIFHDHINHCDYDHETAGEVRLLPTGGGGNVIVCYGCFLKEMRFRRDRAAGGVSFDLPRWEELELYEGG